VANQNKRYLLLFASIALLMLLGGDGGRNTWRRRRQRDAYDSESLVANQNKRYLLLFASIAWDICSCLMQSRGIFALFLLDRVDFCKEPNLLLTRRN